MKNTQSAQATLATIAAASTPGTPLASLLELAKVKYDFVTVELANSSLSEPEESPATPTDSGTVEKTAAVSDEKATVATTQEQSDSEQKQPPSTATKVDAAPPIKIEWAVASMIPYIYREVVLRSNGAPGKPPIKLPTQVSHSALDMILEYCRYHAVQGRSDKERTMFDEKFTRMDSSKLCELTSAAHALEFTPLVDVGSKGIARLIRGRSPEQIRELFGLPDDLTEEEKLEPLPHGFGPLETRIRLLNHLNARKRQQLLQGKNKNASESASASQDPALRAKKDDRPIDELLSFIEDTDRSKSSGGKSKSKKKSSKSKAKSPPPASQPPTAIATSPQQQQEQQPIKQQPSSQNKDPPASTEVVNAAPSYPQRNVNLPLGLPQVSLIDDFDIDDLESGDDSGDELDPFQAYLVNLALMRQQAPVTTLTSLTQFKARMANGCNGVPGVVENATTSESAQTAMPELNQQEPGHVIDVESDVDELKTVSVALSRLFKECGLETALQVVAWPGASGLPKLPEAGFKVRAALPQAGGTLELVWKPAAADP